jgi:hypothetical protein
MLAGGHHSDVLLQFNQKGHGPGTGFHTELLADGLEQRCALQSAVMNVKALVVIGIQVGQQVLNQGGFAGSGRTGYGKAFSMLQKLHALIGDALVPRAVKRWVHGPGIGKGMKLPAEVFGQTLVVGRCHRCVSYL